MEGSGYVMKDTYRELYRFIQRVLIYIEPVLVIGMILWGLPIIIVAIIHSISLVINILITKRYYTAQYYINETGVGLQYNQGKIGREFKWEQIQYIGLTLIGFPSERFHQPESCYVISDHKTVIVEDNIVPNLKDPILICIPRNEEIDQCIQYYSHKLVDCTLEGLCEVLGQK